MSSKDKRRIAVVAATFPPAVGGGVASAHHQLASLLSKAGAEVRRFSFLDPLPSDAMVTRRDSPAWWKKSARKGCRLAFRLLDPSGRAYQLADILEGWPGARRLRREVLAFAPDEIILPDHGCPGLGLGRFPASTRLTLVAHHNPMRFVDQPGLNAHSILDAKAAVLLENLALRHVGRVVAPCVYMADCFRQTYKYTGPITVIPNLIDLEGLDDIKPYDPRPEMCLASDAALVYIPSAGSHFKGSTLVPELLKLLCDTRQEKFGVFLSGHVSKELLAQLPEGLPVHAPGALCTNDNLARVKSCRFALSPALIENFSMALLEAQFLGLPVATFRVGGNGEMIVDGETGLLAEAEDVPGLAKASNELFDHAWGGVRSDAIKRSCKERFGSSRWLCNWLQ